MIMIMLKRTFTKKEILNAGKILIKDWVLLVLIAMIAPYSTLYYHLNDKYPNIYMLLTGIISIQITRYIKKNNKNNAEVINNKFVKKYFYFIY